ncbi:hypothetical protein CHU93_02070 [Sandarakinorhabdus cyanobacteriorum]|uniref:Uncharacterized protein n=1 Tax=Sandarakinorhabdus cyanobacteriorum TaxID=1981098 RepID=A0A255Z1H4_9SPHN|nr:hypothetical protein CHU93_02070 [Sandarakinorhabdus cyanobacteriorum]
MPVSRLLEKGRAVGLVGRFERIEPIGQGRQLDCVCICDQRIDIRNDAICPVFEYHKAAWW